MTTIGEQSEDGQVHFKIETEHRFQHSINLVSHLESR